MSGSPPRLAARILRALLPPGLRDEALDELADLHALRAARRGSRAADRWYRRAIVGYAARLWVAGIGIPGNDDRTGGSRVSWRWAMGTWVSDLGYAVRTLSRNPGFTVVAVLTLALGIGANTAIFSVVRTVLLRPLPFPEPDRIVELWETRLDRGWTQSSFTHANFWDVRDMNRTFDAVGALRWSTANLTGGGEPERLGTALVSADFFGVLGVEAAIGRTFARGEDEPGGEGRIILLSHDFWQRRLNGATDVVGRALTLDGLNHTVIGVLPDGEPWLDAGDVFLPLVRQADADRGSFELAVIGRLRAGITPDAAHADLSDVATRLAGTYPEAGGMGIAIGSSARWVADEDLRRALWILMGGVGMLLLIACVNLANLLLARATGRTRERALRTALGARRSRLVSLVLSESIVIGLLGATFGLGLAWGIVRFVRLLDPGRIPRLAEVSIDGSVLAYTMAVALVTGLAIGIVPALRAPYRDIAGLLREGERSVAGHRRQGRLRGLLVGIEVALSLVLLVGAGLLARSFGALLSVERGFETENRVFIEVALPSGYDSDRHRLFLTELLARVAAVPRVRSASAVNVRPLRGVNVGMGYAAGDRPPPDGDAVPWASWRLVTADYFETMGVPIVAGRAFTEQDEIANPWRVIVSRRIANELWPGENAVGRTLNLWQGQNGSPAEIVGVAGDMRDWGLEAGITRAVYIPYYGAAASPMHLAVHTDGPPAAILPAVRSIVTDMNPDVPLSNIRTFEEMVGASVASRRFLLLLLSAFAGVALLLALAGVYGVLSYAVARSRAEIGTRMALGASRSGVMRLIVLQGMRPVVLGLAVGLAGALALSRVLGSLLFDIAPADATTYLAVTGLIAIAAMVSCWLPAHRATRLDVVAALRED